MLSFVLEYNELAVLFVVARRLKPKPVFLADECFLAHECSVTFIVLHDPRCHVRQNATSSVRNFIRTVKHKYEDINSGGACGYAAL